MSAGIDDQRAGLHERRHFIQAQRLLDAIDEAPRGGTIERCRRLCHLGDERGHACSIRGIARAGERGVRRRGAQRAQRELRRGRLGDGNQQWRRPTHIEAGQCIRGLIKAAQQQQAPRRDQPRLERVGAVAARFERGGRSRQRARRPVEIAHRERDLGLGNDAACTCHRLMRTEAACGTPQQLAGARVLAELRERDTAQREGRWIIAQRDPMERAERVAAGEGARGGGNQGVHEIRVLRSADGVRLMRVRENRSACRYCALIRGVPWQVL